jgi:hypothetical protein
MLPIAEAGASPVCPHTMTAELEGTLTNAFWYEATLSLLAACDAILMAPGWERSTGAVNEFKWAGEHALPRFEAKHLGEIPDTLTAWIKERLP